MDFRRAYILMKLSESLTDEERSFLAGQGKGRKDEELMNKLNEIKRGQSFIKDAGANIAGNAIYDIGLALLKQLIKKI